MHWDCKRSGGRFRSRKADCTDFTMSDFLTNLDPHEKVLLLLGGFSLPFDDASVVLIREVSLFTTGRGSWNLGEHMIFEIKRGEQKNFWYLKGGTEEFYISYSKKVKKSKY